MKRYLIKKFIVAGIALSAVSSVFAQDTKEKEKEKEKKDVQQIIITRKGDPNEKTVIEIKGDKVTVNGKDVNELKDEDVNVKVNKIRDVMALRMPMAPGPQGWNFDLDSDDDHISLFTEDANRAMLGVMTESDDKGARITSVSKESAAEKAGLKSGDIITKVDDQKVEGSGDVTRIIRKSKPGTKVTITYLRDGKEQKVTTELGKWKGVRMNTENFNFNIPEPPRIAFSYGGAPKLGLSVQDTEDGKGVKVLEVEEDSNAAKAGIKEDDIITKVNDEEVNSADEISRQVRANKDKASYRMQILRNGKTQTIEVKVPRKLKTTDL